MKTTTFDVTFVSTDDGEPLLRTYRISAPNVNVARLNGGAKFYRATARPFTLVSIVVVGSRSGAAVGFPRTWRCSAQHEQRPKSAYPGSGSAPSQSEPERAAPDELPVRVPRNLAIRIRAALDLAAEHTPSSIARTYAELAAEVIGCPGYPREAGPFAVGDR